MKIFYMFSVAMLLSLNALAQNKLVFNLQDARTSEPLSGATISLTHLNRQYSTDAEGRATIDLPQGGYTVRFSYIGYETRTDTLQVPVNDTTRLNVLLMPADDEELDEVTVTTTRSSRTISSIPTRIEVIAGEELDEKANMKPGDIRMILNESTGIQTQQTSATSANASIRIQGLDGRYTQILKDGFPLYAGAANGLGLLQTPPLDLQQVEVIKGSASTLYGGGAIAGLVNLISKRPAAMPEFNVHLNGTTAGGLDMNGFFSQKFGKAGMTLFAARNSNNAYAPRNVDFTAIPDFTRYTLNPKFFLDLNDRTSLDIGVNTSIESRTGGDLHYIKGEQTPGHTFFERNKTERLSSQFSLLNKIGPRSSLNLKNSISYFNRRINLPAYTFHGTQYATFSEADLSIEKDNLQWVTGLNLWTDQFIERQKTSAPLRDYRQVTFGGFTQGNFHAAEWLEIEAGLRLDHVGGYGSSVLPRASALIRFTRDLTSRLGGGLGYKAPTIFTEESERIQYQGVLPVSSDLNRLEKSYGFNWDVNYRTILADKLSFSINHLVFYTLLSNPLMMQPLGTGQVRFNNIDGHIDTRGMETNVKLTYEDLKLFVGYSFTDAQLHEGGSRRNNPLTARHRLNNVLMYEVEDQWKLGAEAYYYSSQELTDGAFGKPYWIFGFMAEKLWDRFSIYLNFENFTDTRQTRFDTINSGTATNPVFRDIYAPLDGFVMNGGVKIKL